MARFEFIQLAWWTWTVFFLFSPLPSLLDCWFLLARGRGFVWMWWGFFNGNKFAKQRLRDSSICYVTFVSFWALYCNFIASPINYVISKNFFLFECILFNIFEALQWTHYNYCYIIETVSTSIHLHFFFYLSCCWEWHRWIIEQVSCECVYPV